MFKSPYSIVRRLIFGFALTLSLLISFGYMIDMPVYSSDPPVLTFYAVDGIKAELSNYSLTDYSQTNGIYKGKFCLTLKNTSQISAPHRPFFLTGFYIEGGLSGYKIISYSIDGNFVGSIHGDTSVIGLWSDGSWRGDSVKNGIPQNGIASFCLNLEKNNPFTIDDLSGKLRVVFSDGIPASYSFLDMNSNNNRYATVTISALSDNQMCFRVRSRNNRSVVGELPPTITGAGFDLPGNRGLFELVSVNTENTNQIYRFSTSFQQLRFFYDNTSGRLDFGILTGQLFIKGSSQQNFESGSCGGTISPVYCVKGDFRGLEPTDILKSAMIRFDNGVILRWNNERPNDQKTVGYDDEADCGVVVTLPSIRGTVASNPR